MKKTLLSILAIGFCVAVSAADPAKPASAAGCAVDAKPTDPKFTTKYEDVVYRFCSEPCLTKWKSDREASLYQQIGGKAAVDAAVERFYVKVLADDRVKGYFADVDMVRQRAKQKAFIAAALGSPVKWEGKDMRKAHAKLPGLNDSHFNAIAENLKATLLELGLKKEVVDKILAIVETTRADVLNRPKQTAAGQ